MSTLKLTKEFESQTNHLDILFSSILFYSLKLKYHFLYIQNPKYRLLF